MDYCRVDYKNGFFEFFKNDTPISHKMDTGEIYTEYRSHKLMMKTYNYQRIKRIKELPEGRKIGIIYEKEKSKS